MILAALVFVLLMSPALPRTAFAACPTNIMSAPGINQTSSNPSGSLAGSYTCTEGTNIHHTASGQVSYDLSQGNMAASIDAQILCEGASEVHTHDTFTLTGPAGASPISFSAVINVYSYALGFSFANASIREGASNASPLATPGGPSTVGITITAPPGASFDLYMDGRASGGYLQTGVADVNVWLSFPDLPPGFLLTSCQGFTAGVPVPVRATSWGRLKTVYR